MSWGKSSDRAAHRARGQALTGAIDGAGLGSRGGAPIWKLREAWMPKSRWAGGDSTRWRKPGASHRANRLCTCPDPTCIKHGFDRQRRGHDPDGFAVFGRYPKGFLDHVIKAQYLGRVGRDDILHVCSGTLGPEEKWTVDIRADARPRVQASGSALPFCAGAFKAVMLDPPYSDQYAKNLYGVENPRPSWLLKEAARVCQPGGRVGILHVAVPFSPPDTFLVNVYGISTGVGFRIRAFTVYERHQQGLAL